MSYFRSVGLSARELNYLSFHRSFDLCVYYNVVFFDLRECFGFAYLFCKAVGSFHPFCECEMFFFFQYFATFPSPATHYWAANGRPENGQLY